MEDSLPVLVIGRFLGISTTLAVTAFLVLVANKIDGNLGNWGNWGNWGLVFLPLWLLHALFAIVGIRYLRPSTDTAPASTLPALYRPIRTGRRFALVMIWFMALAFEIMLVIELAGRDSFDLSKSFSAEHVSELVDQLQCRWPSSDCEDLLSAQMLRDIIDCRVSFTPEDHKDHILVNIIFIPIYMYLSMVFLALVIPPSFPGYVWIDAYLPVVFAGYFSPPPKFGLPTQGYEEIRLSSTGDFEEREGEGEAFPEKYPTQRDETPPASDEEDTGTKVRINLGEESAYPPLYEVDTVNGPSPYGQHPDQEEDAQELGQGGDTSGARQAELDIGSEIMK